MSTAGLPLGRISELAALTLSSFIADALLLTDGF